MKQSIAMAAYPKTKPLAPSRSKAITEKHKLITGFIPKITEIESKAVKEEAAAEKLGKEIDSVGNKVMGILAHQHLQEPKSVYNLQVIAREKKDDFVDAKALMKGLGAVEKKRAKRVKDKKIAYEKG